nr:hypothetical protein [Mycoplasmopsis agalactiae]
MLKRKERRFKEEFILAIIGRLNKYISAKIIRAFKIFHFIFIKLFSVSRINEQQKEKIKESENTRSKFKLNTTTSAINQPS